MPEMNVLPKRKAGRPALDPNDRTVTVSASVPRRIQEEILKVAEERKVSASSIVRDIIVDFFTTVSEQPQTDMLYPR